MSDNAAEANPTRIAGGFFAIDRGAFRCAAAGGLNAAVAHLVMARGTGPDRARRAKFPPCGSILIRAAQTRRQRPQPSHPRSQGAGKRRFVIAESAEG
jgi:hypothetical protein